MRAETKRITVSGEGIKPMMVENTKFVDGPNTYDVFRVGRPFPSFGKAFGIDLRPGGYVVERSQGSKQPDSAVTVFIGFAFNPNDAFTRTTADRKRTK